MNFSQLKYRLEFNQLIDFLNLRLLDKENHQNLQLRTQTFLGTFRYYLIMMAILHFSLISNFIVEFFRTFESKSIPGFTHLHTTFRDIPSLYWIILIVVFHSFYISGNLPVQCRFVIINMISLLATEFNIVAIGFKTSLDAIEEDNASESLNHTQDCLKTLVEHHQKLLR